MPGAAAMTDYARQLAQGFRRLRFQPALETEYRQHVDVSLRSRVRWISVLGLVVWLGFSLFDFWRIDAATLVGSQFATLEILRATRLCVGLVAVLAVAVALPQSSARGLRAALILLGVAIAWGTAYSVYAYKMLGVPDESSILVLTMLALFLPLGLSLTSQLLLAFFYVGCVVLLALTAPAPPVAEALLRVGVVLALSLAVLAFGAYWREYLRREQFLYRKDAQWLALRDGLTGLYNRRMFTHHLEQSLRQAQRDQQPLALVLIDLDHFKLYNDAYGHPAGDDLLRRLGRVFERFACRPLDLAVRLGGEEFALLLYGSSPAHTRASAQALVEAVQGLGLPHCRSAAAEVVTVSAGAAMLVSSDTMRTLYSRADRLLYEAKHSGRNRCCWERPEIAAENGPVDVAPPIASLAAGRA